MTVASDALVSERRAMLADKGRRLYGKFCGTGGRGICAESFAVYHISCGEAVVAEDLVAYLDSMTAALEQSDPGSRLVATRGLASRIRRHLDEADGPEETPNQALPHNGQALRQFVLQNAHSSGEC